MGLICWPLSAADGAGRYENADNSDKLDHNHYYYQSDVLIDALRASLTANATTVKNALENYVKVGWRHGPAPDRRLRPHLRRRACPWACTWVVETRVPEMVIDTTAPFFVSLPMTSVDGSNATDGGTRWMYDVTLYPKNLTGIPTLEKPLAGESERYWQKQWLQRYHRRLRPHRHRLGW